MPTAIPIMLVLTTDCVNLSQKQFHSGLLAFPNCMLFSMSCFPVPPPKTLLGLGRCSGFETCTDGRGEEELCQSGGQ